jgi:hypothetical protein
VAIRDHAGNLAAALPDLFSPAILALIRLVIARETCAPG